MSTELPELGKSQSKFAANLDQVNRKSEYLNTNFQLIKKGRDYQINDPDYDTNAGNGRLVLDDYYKVIKGNDDGAGLGAQMLIKDTFRSNVASFIFHCLLLLVAVVCGSSVGVFYYYIQPYSQILKASWRLLFLALCISPLALAEYLKGRARFAYATGVFWNWEAWKKMLVASAGYAIWTIALVIAVNHTSIAQANLLINLHPIMIMIYKIINKRNVMKLELIGAALVVVGTILVIYDDDIGSSAGFVNLNKADFWTRNTYGNIIALLGSVGGAIYFTKNRELKDEYPFFLGILMISVLDFIYISIIAIITEEANFSFSYEVGIFGLFTQEWIVIYIVNIAVTGFGAYIGYVVSLQYFQPLLLSIVPNTESIFATLLVFFLGWQTFPGFMTIIAFILIVPGTICIIVGNREVEVREYDIQDDGMASLPFLSMTAPAPRLSTNRLSLLRHYHASSAVAPISWEK